MKLNTFQYIQSDVLFLIIGLIDSDGCLTWSWNKDNTFVPSVSITSKSNREILGFIKHWLKGNQTKTGNWEHHTIKGVEVYCLPLLVPEENRLSSCTLVTTRRYDAMLFFYVIKKVVLNNRQHLKPEGKAILIDMRRFLHFGKSRTGAKSPADFELQFGMPVGYSRDKAKSIANQLEPLYNADIQKAKMQVQQGVYLNGWQVSGFFLGDGGVNVVWGSQLITATVNFTGDSGSWVGLELYAASLIRDGVYRKAWRSSKNDSSRLIVSGVNLFPNFIEPFFQNYPFPDCPKKAILSKVCETASFLTYLKQKQNDGITWSHDDWRQLERLIVQTWDLNPSGKERKFQNPDQYLVNLKRMYSLNKLKIR